MIKKTNFFYQAFFCVILLLFILMLTLWQGYFDAVKGGFLLWLTVIAPSMFPYLIITSILSGMPFLEYFFDKLTPISKKLFNTNGLTLYAFFMSIICGYPVGASIISNLKNKNLISEAEAERASIFCSTSSPTFTILCVGKLMFQSVKLGLLLYIINVSVAILSGILTRNYRKNEPITTPSIRSEKGKINFYDCVYDSVISTLVVGGIITFFYILTEMLYSMSFLVPLTSLVSRLINNKTIGKGVVFGLFECTKGLSVLSSDKISLLSLPFCAFICGFGGISVIMQSIAFLKTAKIKTARFLSFKILHAVLGFIFGLILTLLFL